MRKKQCWMLVLVLALSFMFLTTGSGAEVNAAATIKNFRVSSGQKIVRLRWKKLSAKQQKSIQGIAVFRNGTLIKRLKKRSVTYTDKRLSCGTYYRYQIKAYKKKKKKAVYKLVSPIRIVRTKGSSVKKESTRKNRWIKRQWSSGGNTYKVESLDGSSIFEGDSTREVGRSDWIILYDDGHVETNKTGVLMNQSQDDLIISESSVKGSVHYDMEYLKAMTRAFEIIDGKNYYYKIKYLNQPCSNCGALQLYETNDPNASYKDISHSNSAGRSPLKWIIAYRQDPILNMKEDARFKDVRSVVFGEAGEMSIEIKPSWLTEKLKKEGYNYAEPWCVNYSEKSVKLSLPWVGQYKVKVLDENEIFEQWITGLIRDHTKNSMTPKEKLKAIEGYLGSKAVYLPSARNEDGEWVLGNLAEEYGIPHYLLNRWDSSLVPSALVRIGNRLGYPLRSLYGEYERGTALWYNYHFYAESIEEPGELFGFCPPRSSGMIENCKMIDYDTYDFYEAYR